MTCGTNQREKTGWQGEQWRSWVAGEGGRESCGDDGWQGEGKNFLVL